jgi:hypothetical protein
MMFAANVALAQGLSKWPCCLTGWRLRTRRSPRGPMLRRRGYKLDVIRNATAFQLAGPRRQRVPIPSGIIVPDQMQVSRRCVPRSIQNYVIKAEISCWCTTLNADGRRVLYHSQVALSTGGVDYVLYDCVNALLVWVNRRSFLVAGNASSTGKSMLYICAYRLCPFGHGTRPRVANSVKRK